MATDGAVARYVFDSGKRRSDGTARPACFYPPPNLQLSVTRHDGITEEQIWTVGHEVGVQRAKALRGRADVMANVFVGQGLEVVPEPVEGNPNHANVVGWPQEKEDQKAIALEIAAESAFLEVPAQ